VFLMQIKIRNARLDLNLVTRVPPALNSISLGFLPSNISTVPRQKGLILGVKWLLLSLI
jgi:hypothetical protein